MTDSPTDITHTGPPPSAPQQAPPPPRAAEDDDDDDGYNLATGIASPRNDVMTEAGGGRRGNAYAVLDGAQLQTEPQHEYKRLALGKDSDTGRASEDPKTAAARGAAAEDNYDRLDRVAKGGNQPDAKRGGGEATRQAYDHVGFVDDGGYDVAAHRGDRRIQVVDSEYNRLG